MWRSRRPRLSLYRSYPRDNRTPSFLAGRRTARTAEDLPTHNMRPSQEITAENTRPVNRPLILQPRTATCLTTACIVRFEVTMDLSMDLTSPRPHRCLPIWTKWHHKTASPPSMQALQVLLPTAQARITLLRPIASATWSIRVTWMPSTPLRGQRVQRRKSRSPVPPMVLQSVLISSNSRGTSTRGPSISHPSGTLLDGEDQVIESQIHTYSLLSLLTV